MIYYTKSNCELKRRKHGKYYYTSIFSYTLCFLFIFGCNCHFLRLMVYNPRLPNEYNVNITIEHYLSSIYFYSIFTIYIIVQLF